jgi:hypothetical protein
MHIAKRHRVSEHTVRAIRAREGQAIAERKQRLMSIFANVAEISAERMEELAGQASLRDAGTTAGIATDKLLALSGDPALTVHHLRSLDFRLEDDDLLAYCLALSHANEEQQQRLKSIGLAGFAIARSRLQQAQPSQKVIEAEIVRRTPQLAETRQETHLLAKKTQSKKPR